MIEFKQVDKEVHITVDMKDLKEVDKEVHVTVQNVIMSMSGPRN